MKKSLLALGAACIALSSMAAATPKQKLQKPEPLKLEKDIQLKNFTPKKHAQPSMKAPAKVNSSADVITEAEGKKQDVKITGSGITIFGSWLMLYENTEYASNVVYGDNDEVYIYNIIPDAITDTYVKGVKKDDKVVVELPQTVVFYDDYGYGLNVNICVAGEEGSENLDYVAADDATLIFSVKEDGSMVAEGLSQDRILTLTWTDDDSWYYYSTWDLTIEPFNATPVVAPADIEVSENFWSYIGESIGYGWNVSWLQGYDEVYFKGLSPNMPDALVKATVEYDDSEAILSIAQNQYIGKYYDYYFVFTKCAQIVVDEEGYEDYAFMPDDYVYQLVWDYEEMTLKPKDPNVVLLLNTSTTSVSPLETLEDFVMQHQESYEGTPQNPRDLMFLDYMDDYGECDFYFDVPALSTDGDLLLTENLSYVIYVDDEEWEFDADDYYLDESMVEIPWSFQSDFILQYVGITHVALFFAEGISTIGVQSIYRYDGEETRSEIVTIDVDDPVAVDAVNAGKKVASVKCYDVAGREVANDATGVVIKRVVYEDGTVGSFKKIVR